VSVNMNYGRQIFPSDVFRFSGQDWRTDWNASVNVSVPIFSGFRRQAEIDQARITLEQERLRLGQLRESVQLQFEQARGERERAAATISARRRTVDQAQRVHDLTVLRYEQGLATQLEVSDARLALLQARTNLAQAISDFRIADASLTRSLGGSARAQAESRRTR
jgi:outer membrane protein TolC